MFTIVLGLLALVGTNNLKTHVRYAIAVAFIVIDTPIILSQYYSQKLHDALHQEIYDYVTEHPDMFTKKDSQLKERLIIQMEPKPHKSIAFNSINIVIALGTLVAILFMNRGGRVSKNGNGSLE